jgi:hypothetical protein
MKNRQRHDSVNTKKKEEEFNWIFIFLGNILYSCNALWIKICL